MIASSPAILGLAFDNIDAKIAGLKERGFTDPQKMIASSPAILGYGFDNIDAKIALINRLAEHYKLEISAPELMGQENALFSSKIDKLWVLARVARNVGSPQYSLQRLCVSCCMRTWVCCARATRSCRKTFAALMNATKEVKAQGDGREERRERIKSFSDSDPIARRHLRGYPLRK